MTDTPNADQHGSADSDETAVAELEAKYSELA